MNRKYPNKIGELFGKKVLVLLAQNLRCSDVFVTQKIGSGYYNVELSGNEDFNKSLFVGILENVLTAEIERTFFVGVVSKFVSNW